MKIIKHGKKKEIKYYFICTSCGCEFEMTNIELMKEQQSVVFTAINPCPDCGEKVQGKEELCQM